MLNSFKKLFNKKISSKKFGVALRQSIGSYCIANPDSATGIAQEFNSEASTKGSEWLDELLVSGVVSGSGYLVLSNQFYSIAQIDKPDLPEEEILPSLKWLVKDIVPIEPDDMMVDYTDAPVLLNGIARINVVCCHFSQLKNFTDSFKKHNIALKGIVTESIAFSNLLPVTDEAVLLLCQQPYEDILILIVVNGQIFFNRHLRGFSEIGGLSSEQLNNGICDALSVEIQKSLDFFERQLKQKNVTNIKVLLPVINENIIIEKLSKNTMVPVSTLSLPEQYTQNRGCAAAIGGSMEINLVEALNE